MSDNRLARGRRWFEYHCYEGEDSDDAALWHHTHQWLEIIGKEPNCDTGRMYQVRFADGLVYTVFDDELLHGPDDNQRPDYLEPCTEHLTVMSGPRGKEER